MLEFGNHPVNIKLRELRNSKTDRTDPPPHRLLKRKKNHAKFFKRRNRGGKGIRGSKVCRRVIADLTGMQPADRITNLKTLAALLHSNDTTEQLQAALELRKLVSMDQDPPLQEVIDSGAVPQLLKLLANSENHELQFESCWAITNLVSGTTKHTTAVLDYGAAETLVTILKSPKVQLDVKEQAVWALGNIGGDGSECRDMLLDLNVMRTLLHIMLQPQKRWRRGQPNNRYLAKNEIVSLSMKRTIIWTISNLCRGKPQPAFEVVAPVIPIISSLMTSDDEEVLRDSCWALSYLSDDHTENNVYIQAVIDAGVIKDLVRLLNHESITVQIPALRAIGNIVTGSDKQTTTVVAAGSLKALRELMLSESKASIRKEVVWTISNITAGTTEHIQAVIVEDLMKPMLEMMLPTVVFEIRKEAIWAVSNATGGATADQIQYLVDLGAIEGLCASLGSSGPRLLDVALTGLENIMKTKKESYAIRVEACGGLDTLEYLQEHPCPRVYEKVYSLLTSAFDVEEHSEVPCSFTNAVITGDGADEEILPLPFVY